MPQPTSTMVPVTEDREKKTNRRKSYREKYRSPGPLVNRVPRVGVMETICNDESSPCPVLVLLYARLGLHRYNLLHGKNLQLSSVKKYSKSTHSAASSYYITSEAMDLALQPFETKVYERTYGRLVLSCNIARPLGETIGGEIKRSKIKRNSLCKDLHLTDTMPEWPKRILLKIQSWCLIVQRCKTMTGFVCTWNLQLPLVIGTALQIMICPTWRLSNWL